MQKHRRNDDENDLNYNKDCRAKSADVKTGLDLTDATSGEIRSWIERNATK